MLNAQRHSLRDHCLPAELLLLLGVHVVVVIDQRHGAFAAVAPTFQELEVWEPVAVTAPAPPILHRNGHGLVAVKSVIRMKMILLVFERLVRPVQAEIVQSVPSYTAALFGIQDILDFAVGHPEVCDLVEHFHRDFIVVAVDVALHLL